MSSGMSPASSLADHLAERTIESITVSHCSSEKRATSIAASCARGRKPCTRPDARPGANRSSRVCPRTAHSCPFSHASAGASGRIDSKSVRASGPRRSGHFAAASLSPPRTRRG